MSFVLYLSQQYAVWVRVQGAKLLDVRHCYNDATESVFTRCPWPIDKCHPIHLLIDTQAEEISLHPLKRSRSGLQQRINERALRQQLVEAHPNSIIYTPSVSFDGFIVNRLHMSPALQKFVSKVEAQQLYVRSYTTVIECAAVTAAKMNRPCIVIMQLFSSCKHIYCVGGHALFTRQLAHASLASLKSNLIETIDHLRAADVLQGDFAVLSIGVSEDALSALADIASVHGTARYEDDDAYQAITKSGLAITDEVIPIVAMARQLSQTSQLTRNTSQRCVTIPLVQFIRLRTSRKKRVLNTAMVSLLLLSCGVTVSIELDRRQRGKSINLQKGELLTDISDIKSHIEAISPAGEQVAQALLAKAALDLNRAESPAALLNLLAKLLSTHRELALSELQWAVIDESASDTIDVQQQNLFSPRFRSSTRSLMGDSSVLLVRLDGRLASSLSLRKQQAAVDAIAGELIKHPQITQLIFHNTPLSQAAQSSRADLGPEIGAAKFSFHFQLNRAGVNDA